MHKRGWIRIVEASISIIMILTALFVFYQEEAVIPASDLSQTARQILEEVARNESLRRVILTTPINQEDINGVIRSRLPSRSLEFEARVCPLNDACGKSVYTPGEVYAAERVISAAEGQLVPKKIRLFIWRA